MAITAIPGLLQNTPAETNAPAAHPPQPAVNAPADTVQLTVAEHVYQLYTQGQQVSQIAAALNLSVDAVNNYLNISNNAA